MIDQAILLNQDKHMFKANNVVHWLSSEDLNVYDHWGIKPFKLSNDGIQHGGIPSLINNDIVHFKYMLIFNSGWFMSVWWYDYH